MSSIIPGYEYDIFISYRQKDNKHDGLLETYDVDASLKGKLKCLVFIPNISRTYCDPKSFAWEHEFKAFVEQGNIGKEKGVTDQLNERPTTCIV